MRVKPLAERRRPKPVALVLAAGRGYVKVVTAAGDIEQASGPRKCADLLASFREHFVYTATRPTALLHTTGALAWSGYQWKGALVRVKLDGGPTIYPVRRAVEQLDHPATALFAVLRWLAGLGVNPGSLGSMAYRLWRATLASPVSLRGPELRDPLYGGRQEAPWPGEYRGGRYWDLGAAYPYSMAAEPYPGRLIAVSPRGLSLDGIGIARAEVRIPSAEWCPLPVRVGKGALCYGWGDAEGWWSWRELRMAKAAGCEVVVREAWAGMGQLDLFGPWWELVKQGRAMSGGGGAVVKAITSSLWGQFALEADGGRLVRWRDDAGRRPIVVSEVRAGHLPQAAAVYVAIDTTARVRCRLWSEGLSRSDAIYCDTDAVIAGKGAGPAPSGRSPGRWSLRASMVKLDLRGPQVFRYLCPECNVTDAHAPWHHVVAGAPTPETAAAVFRRAGSRTNVASMAPGDITLPAGPLSRFMTREVSVA